jgi:hypothetical protein
MPSNHSDCNHGLPTCEPPTMLAALLSAVYHPFQYHRLGNTVRDYHGNFEVHLTANLSPHAITSFAAWCQEHNLKCVHIILARGESADQPMATWRRGATRLATVLAHAHELAADATARGFAITRVKVEADPSNPDVPVTDADIADHEAHNYFEHHVKLKRPTTASRELLLSVCERHAAHLSHNALRADGEFEVRFVTQRAYAVGRHTALAKLDRLLAELRSLNETILEHEAEYCVFDSNLQLDAGWLLPATV